MLFIWDNKVILVAEPADTNLMFTLHISLLLNWLFSLIFLNFYSMSALWKMCDVVVVDDSRKGFIIVCVANVNQPLQPEKNKNNYENYLFGNNKAFKLQYLMVMLAF